MKRRDYMLFDPLINEDAELHERQRDLRLDVDNISYEELLALEEHIGDMNTGLSEKKTRSFYGDSEPCCIYQKFDVDTLQGDHVTNVYKGFLESNNSSKWCHKNFINYHVMMVLILKRTTKKNSTTGASSEEEKEKAFWKQSNKEFLAEKQKFEKTVFETKKETRTCYMLGPV
ncbi:probable E3 ubiquitin-protein ligase RHG1A isoform X2 [Helianthus annuus]|uniref:probable E3 ubiquitin-protein ligase RHG1A isoform X2 n=1 Tax=Helianthus annuus TaxID=4232 RepID=UPI001652FB1D|nr:probable E3 ubiquitin-protein ligase RHG1A isoform X2 [Helianthus annuus]